MTEKIYDSGWSCDDCGSDKDVTKVVSSNRYAEIEYSYYCADCLPEYTVECSVCKQHIHREFFVVDGICDAHICPGYPKPSPEQLINLGQLILL